MHMVGHQHVGVKLAACLFQRFTEQVQAGEIVFFGEEARRTTMTPLDDVQRDVVEAGGRGHLGRLAEIYPGPFCQGGLIGQS